MAQLIFINYRRDDSAPYAGRIYDRLERDFRGELFMDVDILEPGSNFKRALHEAVEQCDIFLTLIGPRWVDAKDKKGKHRLADATDFVRVEISEALARDIPLLPLLLDGTPMPSAEDLPDEIKDLSTRHAIPIRHASFHADMDKLVRAIRLTRERQSEIKKRTSIDGNRSKEAALGIDLGTSRCTLSYLDSASVKIIQPIEGESSIPAIVCELIREKDDNFSRNTDIRIGVEAREKAFSAPLQTWFAVNRLLDPAFDNPNFQKWRRHVSFPIDGTNSSNVVLGSRPKRSPTYILGQIIDRAMTETERYLGTRPRRATVTLPYSATISTRWMVRQAAADANLECRVIAPSAAAALAYGHGRKWDGTRTVAFYDFGAGKFEVSILEIGDGVYEVKSCGGDAFLGGEDFDTRLVGHFIDEFRQSYAVDLTKDEVAVQRLKVAAEKAKKELSAELQTEINVPYIAGTRHFVAKLTRPKFDGLVADLIERTRSICQQVVRDAGISTAEIQELVLIGGTTRIPGVRALAKQVFGRDPTGNVNPEMAAASGAAIHAGILQGDVRDVLLLDVVPKSIGVQTLGGVFTRMIDRNTTIPTKKSSLFSPAEPGQMSVTVRVFEGEHEMCGGNTMLSQFELSGIEAEASAPAKIEITIDIDASGVLFVSAENKATGRIEECKIGFPPRLNDFVRDLIERSRQGEVQGPGELIVFKEQSESQPAAP